MNRIFITNIHINQVRHLKNIDIPVYASNSDGEMRHLILTGKNGSGKTSLLEALKGYLNSFSTSNDPFEAKKNLKSDQHNLELRKSDGAAANEISDIQNRIDYYKKRIDDSTFGLELTFNCDASGLKASFEKGEYILAYYGAHRFFKAEEPTSIEKVSIKKAYGISENPRQQFLKYMLDLKMTQSLAAMNGTEEKKEKAEEIQAWFDKIEDILRDIYEDPDLTMEFDEETYRFIIHTKDREPFDFNTASDGFSAVLDIIVGIILRMQQQDRRVVNFTKPGIVLIDEIEDHLQLALQRSILPYLTKLFPNIQFIVTTHSPFVVISLKDAVIYDLENKKLASDGLNDVSYTGAVRGYFDTSEYSEQLEQSFREYKKLTDKKNISAQDGARIMELQNILDEMPDYLMPEIATEYRRIKLEFEQKEGLADGQN